MRIITKIALAGVAAAVSVPASAVPVLSSAEVTGPTGTVWNTTVDSFYSLFIRHPTDDSIIYKNDNYAGIAVDSDPDYQISGDGWPTNSTKPVNSDPFYVLKLVLTEGANSITLTGQVVPGLSPVYTPLVGTGVLNGKVYSLDAFSWQRFTDNLVGPYTVASRTGQTGGSRFDYQGTFSLSSAGVPEPATWGLMILGFGAVAGTMRRRRSDAVAAVA